MHKKKYQSLNLLNKKYDFVFCDSLEALNYYYKKGLSKNYRVISSSPGILNESKINSQHLYKNWKTKNFRVFQESIFDFSLEIFKKVSEKHSKEEAIVSAILSNNFNKILIKLSQLDNSFKNKKILFIEISEIYANAKSINPPWKLLKKFNNVTTISYKPELEKRDKNKDLPNKFNRLILGGFEAVVYRIFTKYFKGFKNEKNLIVVSENELIMEVASKLFLKGYGFFDLRNIKKNEEEISFTQKQNIIEIEKLLYSIVEKRCRAWVVTDLLEISIKTFYNQLSSYLSEFYTWINIFNKMKSKSEFKKYKGKTFIFCNHPSSPRGLACKTVFNALGYKLVSFQHGVTAEISASHNYCLSQHDSSSSDYYFAFNKGSDNVAKNNPFANSTSLIYGAPNRYKRQNYLINLKEDYPILFLSNKLYKGNYGGLNTWQSDFDMAKAELKIIDILNKINKKVFFKFYPESFKRYLEIDPCETSIDKSSNITLLKKSYDARYLMGNAKLLICCTATSTFSWAIMSEKPVVFINYNNLAPLNKKAHQDFQKGLFLFDFDSKNFSSNLESFLNLPYSKIYKKWKYKHSQRTKIIDSYISTNTNKKNLLYELF